MPALAGKKGRVYGATSQVPTAIVEEPMTANADRTQYTVTDSAKRYLDPLTAVSLESSPDGVTWNPVQPNEFQYAGGVAVFDPGLAVGTQVRIASGAYFPVAPIAECKGWSVDVSLDLEDSTPLGSDWKRYTPIMNGWEGSLDRFQQDSYFMDRIVAGLPVLLVLYVNEPSGLRYEGFANISGLGTSLEATALVEETVDATGEGGLYQR
ncbi:MAG: hypothetical protein M0P69_15000 [Bacteroidales bacterium]|nr:hypothetical protein [Bacteroidales bacterium]